MRHRRGASSGPRGPVGPLRPSRPPTPLFPACLSALPGSGPSAPSWPPVEGASLACGRSQAPPAWAPVGQRWWCGWGGGRYSFRRPGGERGSQEVGRADGPGDGKSRSGKQGPRREPCPRGDSPVCTGQRAHEDQEHRGKVQTVLAWPPPTCTRPRAPGSCRPCTPSVVTGPWPCQGPRRAVATCSALPPPHSACWGGGPRAGPLPDSTPASPSLLLTREAGG